jgi:hypothetical protein
VRGGAERSARCAGSSSTVHCPCKERCLARSSKGGAHGTTIQGIAQGRRLPACRAATVCRQAERHQAASRRGGCSAHLAGHAGAEGSHKEGAFAPGNAVWRRRQSLQDDLVGGVEGKEALGGSMDGTLSLLRCWRLLPAGHGAGINCPRCSPLHLHVVGPPTPIQVHEGGHL